MSMENLGPYSNFHQLNQDWFLNEFNKVLNSWESLQKNFNNLQDAFNDLKKYVQDYFKNLDVQDEINKKLDEMYANGNLSELLLEHCIIPTITPQYIGSRLIERAVAPYATENIDISIPFEMEGVCHVGENRIICFYSPGGEGNITKNSDVLIEEYDISVPFNPSRIRSATLTGLMHANACCYNNGKIYVATWGYYDNNTFHDSNICGVVDYETLSLVNTIEISGIPALQKISYYNGTFYGANNNDIYSISLNTSEATKLCTINTPYNSIQGIEIRGNIGYALFRIPMILITFNLTTGNVINIYNIDSFLSTGICYNSLADLTFINDSEIIITPHVELDNTSDSLGNPYTTCSVYGNYLAKIDIGNHIVRVTGQDFYNTGSLYITNNFPDTIVYSAGSNKAPFYCLNECIYNKYLNEYNLSINGNVTVRGTSVFNSKNVNIIGSLNCYGYRSECSVVKAYNAVLNNGKAHVERSIILHGLSNVSELVGNNCYLLIKYQNGTVNLTNCIVNGLYRFKAEDILKNCKNMFRNYGSVNNVDLSNITSLLYTINVKHSDNSCSSVIYNGFSFVFDGVTISMNNNIITLSENCEVSIVI